MLSKVRGTATFLQPAKSFRYLLSDWVTPSARLVAWGINSPFDDRGEGIFEKRCKTGVQVSRLPNFYGFVSFLAGCKVQQAVQ